MADPTRIRGGPTDPTAKTTAVAHAGGVDFLLDGAKQGAAYAKP